MSKNNTMWIAVIVVAAIIGAMMGPALANSLSAGTLLILFVVIIGGAIAFCIWALSSNKGAAKADAAAQADAKALKTVPGKGRIYIVRRGFVAALQGMNVSLDGTHKAQIKSGQMLLADVAAGSHMVHVETAKASLSKPAEITVNVAEGQVVIISASLEMGAMKGSILLTETDPTVGRNDVQATNLMQWDAGAV